MPEKITIKEFLSKSKKRHGDRYCYDNVTNFKNSSSKVNIKCYKHGIFKQTARQHYTGCGCPKCGYIKVSKDLSISLTDFIYRSNLVHNNKYSYSLSIYKGMQNTLYIICHEHGGFWQTPETHLKGCGCPKCSGCHKSSTKEFIKKAIVKQGNKYDYSLVEYINSHTKVKIACLKHGVFNQTPNSHLMGCGCPQCKTDLFILNNPKNKDTKKFIEQAKKVHGNFYDYTYTVYERDNQKITISCQKHGYFLQTPNTHLSGCGCPHCKNSTGEVKIRNILKSYNKAFKQQQKFKDCKDKMQLPFDFYLSDINVLIEYDGEQHFKPIKIFGGLKSFDVLKKHDKIKEIFCAKNNIALIRISYKDNIEKKLKEVLQL